MSKGSRLGIFAAGAAGSAVWLGSLMGATHALVALLPLTAALLILLLPNRPRWPFVATAAVLAVLLRATLGWRDLSEGVDLADILGPGLEGAEAAVLGGTALLCRSRWLALLLGSGLSYAVQALGYVAIGYPAFASRMIPAAPTELVEWVAGSLQLSARVYLYGLPLIGAWLAVAPLRRAKDVERSRPPQNLPH